MMTRTSRPLTYVIDYSDHLDRVDEYTAQVAQSPPHLLHLAHEVPFPNTWGAIRTDNGRSYLMSPRAIRRRIALIEGFTQGLHDAGVEILIPYICNQTIAGDPEGRRGIWKFYDSWERYSEFGFGPTPADPVEWLAREEYGRPHYNYEMRHRAFVPKRMQRYAPCANNPHYRKYQRGVVENIAKVGYDGVFVDNCILNCYCKHCQTRFKEHIQNNYRAQEQKEFFGFTDPSEISLATRGSKLHWVKTQETFPEFLKETFPEDVIQEWLGVRDPSEAWIEEGGNGWLWNMADRYLSWMETIYSPEEIRDAFGIEELGLWGLKDERDRALWAETKIFWARSIAENLKYIKDVGGSIHPPFIILPNWGEMQLRDGNEFREEIGHDLREWQPHSDLQMFEESNEPGRISPGVYLDFQLELKFALANDVRGCVLSHAGRDAATTELSYAECLSGMGSFIQPGVGYREVRAKYRRFQTENSALLEGWSPSYQVGVAHFNNQLHLENPEHVLQVYKFTRYFLDQHVLFHYLTEEDLSPDVRLPCRTVVLPNLAYLSEEQITGIENFMRAGGIVFATGNLGGWDTVAKPREESVLERMQEAFPERFVHFDSIGSVIPDEGISLDAARQFSRTTWRTLNVPGDQSFEAMKHLDGELGIQRYLDSGAWLGIVGQKLEGPAQLCASRRAPGVRFNSYTNGGSVSLHAVNFNVDLLAPPGERSLQPAEALQLDLLAPQGFKLKRAISMEPARDTGKVEAAQDERVVTLALPPMDYYRLVLLEGSE